MWHASAFRCLLWCFLCFDFLLETVSFRCPKLPWAFSLPALPPELEAQWCAHLAVGSRQSAVYPLFSGGLSEPVNSDKQSWLFLAGSSFRIDSFARTLCFILRWWFEQRFAHVIKQTQYTSQSRHTALSVHAVDWQRQSSGQILHLLLPGNCQPLASFKDENCLEWIYK